MSRKRISSTLREALDTGLGRDRAGMLEQGGQISSLSGSIPLGRGLMPEELADFKAKGREWSRLYKERRRKDFSMEQIEERKLKNRLRQKRFRERQKSREQEETERLAGSLHPHQLAEHQAHEQHASPQPHSPHGYEHGAQMQYAAQQQMAPPTDQQDNVSPSILDQHQQQPLETLVEKRKRLGRERQARFREKKRMRTSHSGSQPGNAAEDSQPGMSSGQSGPQHEVMTLAELQKMSAQLSGYYTGLTQGLTQEEHQAVMRFFLEGLREDLGDEIFAGVGFYGIADAHAQAQAAAAHVHYMQGIDLQALQQAAAASGHLAPGEMPNALQNPQVDASGHITGQLHAHMEHQMAPPNQAGELSQAQVQAHFEQYQRQIAEAQQAEIGHHQDANYEAAQAQPADQSPSPNEGQSQQAPASNMEPHGERIMYQQQGVNQEMQPGEPMHYVDGNQADPKYES